MESVELKFYFWNWNGISELFAICHRFEMLLFKLLQWSFVRVAAMKWKPWLKHFYQWERFYYHVRTIYAYILKRHNVPSGSHQRVQNVVYFLMICVFVSRVRSAWKSFPRNYKGLRRGRFHSDQTRGKGGSAPNYLPIIARFMSELTYLPENKDLISILNVDMCVFYYILLFI